MNDTPKDNETIHRVFHLLRIIAVYRGKWFQVSDCAERAALAKSTCHRYLNAFVDEGILEKSGATHAMYRHKQG
jgi:DNA-binding IclR family transcriptional regulator